MLAETSAASTRRRSTRSAAWLEVKPGVATNAATIMEVRRACIIRYLELGEKPAMTSRSARSPNWMTFRNLLSGCLAVPLTPLDFLHRWHFSKVGRTEEQPANSDRRNGE